MADSAKVRRAIKGALIGAAGMLAMSLLNPSMREGMRHLLSPSGFGYCLGVMLPGLLLGAFFGYRWRPYRGPTPPASRP